MLADVSPQPLGMSPGVLVALAVALAATVLVLVVMRPLRGWKRFAARHGLTLGRDGIHGDVAGRAVAITLVADGGPPKTLVTIGAFRREALGRMDEAALEKALADALGTAER